MRPFHPALLKLLLAQIPSPPMALKINIFSHFKTGCQFYWQLSMVWHRYFPKILETVFLLADSVPAETDSSTLDFVEMPNVDGEQR
jgi:hypothetical protein